MPRFHSLFVVSKLTAEGSPLITSKFNNFRKECVGIPNILLLWPKKKKKRSNIVIILNKYSNYIKIIL